MVNEFAVLMLLAAAAVSLASLMGLRGFWLSLPIGLLGISAIRAVVFSTVNMFSLRDWANPIFYGLVFCVLLVAAYRARAGFYVSLYVALGFAVLSGALTRLANYTTMPEADALWTLSLTRLFDESGNLSRLNDVTSMQRGYAYPLMLALGEPGEFLTGFTPLLFAALLMSIIWAVSQFIQLRATSNKLILIAVLATAVSAVMVLRTVFYVSSHNFNAIAVLLSVTAVAICLRDQQVSRSSMAILSISLVALNLNAVEGPAFSFLILIPLLSRQWLTRWRAVGLVCSAAVPHLIWMSTYNVQIIKQSGLVWWVFAPLVLALVVGITLVLFTLSSRFRFQLFWLAPLVLSLTIVTVWLIAPDLVSRGWIALFDNLFGGSGQWGSLAYFVGFAYLALMLTGFKNWSEEFKSLSWSLAVLILGSIVLKTFATNSSGGLSLRRFAWSDNLNRLWFELLAVALVAIIVGFSQRRSSRIN